MIVISPAKRLDNKKADSSLPVTDPIFKNEAKKLASELSKLNSNQLGELMGVSEAIAELNVERYKNWGKAQSPETRAIFQFEGDVFKNFDSDIPIKSSLFEKKFLKLMKSMKELEIILIPIK